MAAITENDQAKVSIKVIVDKVNKRVVYAEADYSFVDILFSFMTLPMGTIVRILGKPDDTKFEALGSLNNLYQSLKDFPECYLSSEECKFMLLNPRNLAYDLCRNLKLQIDDTEPVKYFRCSSGHYKSYFMSTFNKAKCISCFKLMDQDLGSPNSNVCFGGAVFVSDIATFIVTDDLCVMPYTSANSIRLLTDLGITNTSSLEDITLDMDCEQMLYLLKMSLSSRAYQLTFAKILPDESQGGSSPQRATFPLQGLSMMQVSLRSFSTLTDSLKHLLKK